MKRPSKKEIKEAMDRMKGITPESDSVTDHLKSMSSGPNSSRPGFGKLSPKKNSKRIRKQGV